MQYGLYFVTFNCFPIPLHFIRVKLFYPSATKRRSIGRSSLGSYQAIGSYIIVNWNKWWWCSWKPICQRRFCTVPLLQQKTGATYILVSPANGRNVPWAIVLRLFASRALFWIIRKRDSEYIPDQLMNRSILWNWSRVKKKMEKQPYWHR